MDPDQQSATSPRLIEWTGERCTPWADDAQVVYEHYHRYAFALPLARGRRVLDLASGEGYGSALLAGVAASVLGVDVDESSVAHARSRYGSDTVAFEVGSMVDPGLAVPDGSVDLVVCFEALEHVVEHDVLLALVRRVLAPGGLFVVSTPDVEVYSHEHGNDNPFHVRELSEPELRAWVGGFAHARVFRQNVVTGSLIAVADQDAAADGVTGPGEVLRLDRSGQDEWSVRRGGPHTYLLAVAGDSPLPELPSTSTLVEPGLEIVAAHQRAHGATAERAAAREAELAAEVQRARERTRSATELATERAAELARVKAAADAAVEQLALARARADALDEELAATEQVRRRTEDAKVAAEQAALAADHGFAAERRRAEQAEDTLEQERALSAARTRWLAELRTDAEAMASALLPLARTAEEWAASDAARLVGRYRRAVEQLAPNGSARRRTYRRLRGLPAPGPQAGLPLGPVAVHTSEQPVVSIVIPVHGHWEHTRQCLESIEAVRSDVPFEIVAVDDASPDDTADRLEQCRGVRVVRAPRNLGFIGACNLGVESVRSGLVVFLNNDTQVTPGWLDALVDAAHGDPRVGLVGAKLVHPDGTLQECGGIVWRDGSGWNYGRGGPAEGPLVDVRREVDYCSGAALLVRTELFRELGGFDTRYEPAYYEDTDLAFAVRAAGWTTIVEPASVVVHHEGVSHGTDTAVGVKRFQEVNRTAFAAKWAAELADRPDAASPGAVWRWRQRSPRGLVMVVDHAVPRPDHDSGSVRMARVLELLVEQGYGVVFLPFNHDAPEPYTSALRRRGITVIAGVGEQEQFVHEAAGELAMALLSRHHVAYRYLEQLRKHAPQCHVVYDTVDLHHVRLERQAELADLEPAGRAALLREARTMRELELALTRVVDTTLVVSEVERATLLAAVPDADVRVLSNVHDRAATSSVPDGRHRLLFVGSFDHPPNRDAVEWMCREVMPLVRSEVPGVRLTVIGSNPPATLTDELGEVADVQGWVPDLDPYYAAARVVVAPLRFGAGVKGKVGEGLSRGVPTVVSPVALEGMDLVDGHDVLVASTPEEFARAVLRLLVDDVLWADLALHGPDAVDRQFGRAVAARTLAELVPVPSGPR